VFLRVRQLVTTTTNVPPTNVSVASVYIHQSRAPATSVKTQHVMCPLGVYIRPIIAVTTIHVPLIHVVLTSDVLISTKRVTTGTYVPSIAVTWSKDVFLHPLRVTTGTHVP